MNAPRVANRFNPWGWFARRPWLPLAVLAVALLWLAQREDYWGDEGFALRRVEASWRQLYFPFATGVFADSNPFDTSFVYDFNPPLYAALIRVVAGAHPGKIAVRLFSILPLLGTGWLVIGVARRKLGLWGAWVAALIFCSAPGVLYYGVEARPYALGMLAFGGLLWAGEMQRFKQGFWLGLGCGLWGIMSHFQAAWGLLGFGGAALWILRKAGKEDGLREGLSGTLYGLTIAAIVAITFVLPQYQIFIYPYAVPGHAASLAALFQSFIFLLGWGSKAATQWVLMAAVGGVLVAGWGCNKWRVSTTGLLAVGTWGMASIFPLINGRWGHATYYERYAIFGWPALVWLLVCSLAALKEKGWGRVALAWTVMIVAYGLWVGGRKLEQPMRAPWREAVETLRREATARDLYTIRPHWLNVAFAANARQKPAAPYSQLFGEVTSQTQKVWIVTDYELDPAESESLRKRGFKLRRRVGPPAMSLWEGRRN